VKVSTLNLLELRQKGAAQPKPTAEVVEEHWSYGCFWVNFMPDETQDQRPDLRRALRFGFDTTIPA
jgi:hypothetical protein